MPVTQNMLQTLGEWHTHPDGASTLPSPDDLQVIKWLEETMGSDGHPAVMLIVERPGNVGYYVTDS